MFILKMKIITFTKQKRKQFLMIKKLECSNL
uniref:Uncharacterized protein n=1 Tax=Rhizophora mucronata TaxID=61149 RepID=A0A2P2Q596_RHIMU